MIFTDYLTKPGVHPFLIDGPVGCLEGELTVPELVNTDFVAILGHPHSLQGGTMHNKVVTTMVRAFKELQVPSIRFNFRGVGQSLGTFDNGVGESADMLWLLRQWLATLPTKFVFFAGFSFGSYVAYRAIAHFQQSQTIPSSLITIAPSVVHFDYSASLIAPKPWVIMQGDCDEVVVPDEVFEFARVQVPEIPVLRFAETGHFFHGKLLLLKAQLLDVIRPQVVAYATN